MARNVCIFIPISRQEHLDKLFAGLEMLDCDPESVELLTYVDGDSQLFARVEAMTMDSKFGSRVSVHLDGGAPVSWADIAGRRRRIAEIKNHSKKSIPDCRYVLSIEDDTIVPPDCLTILLADYRVHPHAGFIEAVELGRWGWPHVGAWRADDPFDPKKLETALPGSGLEEIDAGGFYCYMTTREHYLMLDYKPWNGNVLGPDVDWGLQMRNQGFKNFIDWRVNCDHLRRDGSAIRPGSTPIGQATVELGTAGWHTKFRAMV